MPSAKLCQFCTGNCCKHYTDIDLTPEDVSRLAQHMGIGFAKVIDRFVRKSPEGDPILRKKDDGWCAFSRGGQCSVYANRPAVCRAFMPPECLDDGVARRRKGVDLRALRAEIKKVRNATR